MCGRRRLHRRPHRRTGPGRRAEGRACRWEARRAPVRPEHHAGLLGRRELTAAAFDEEGYYRLGDALGLVDPADPSKGFTFEGRIAEDFKLSTGTWVRVGPVRAALLSHFSGLVQDVVISGHERDEVTALFFPNLEACRAVIGDQSQSLSARDAPSAAGSRNGSRRSRPTMRRARRGLRAPPCSKNLRRSTRRRSPTSRRSTSAPCSRTVPVSSRSSTVARAAQIVVDVTEGAGDRDRLRPPHRRLEARSRRHSCSSRGCCRIRDRRGHGGAEVFRGQRRSPRSIGAGRLLPIAEHRFRHLHRRRAAVGSAAAHQRRDRPLCGGSRRHRNCIRQRRSDEGARGRAGGEAARGAPAWTA